MFSNLSFRLSLLAICIGILEFSCKSDHGIPADVIPLDSMKVLNWEVSVNTELINQDTATATRKNASELKLQQLELILQKHHISRPDYLKSVTFYEQHPEIQLVLVDSLQAFAQRKSEALNKKMQKLDSIKNAHRPKIKVDSVPIGPIPHSSLKEKSLQPNLHKKLDALPVKPKIK